MGVEAMSNKVSCPASSPCDVNASFVACGKADPRINVVRAGITDSLGVVISAPGDNCTNVDSAGSWSINFTGVPLTPAGENYDLDVEFGRGTCALFRPAAIWPALQISVVSGPVTACSCPKANILIRLFETLFRQICRFIYWLGSLFGGSK